MWDQVPGKEFFWWAGFVSGNSEGSSGFFQTDSSEKNRGVAGHCFQFGLGSGMRVSKLLHTRYRLDDLERSVRFYKDVLGLEEVRRHKSPRGSELVFLKAPDSEETIELCHFPSSGPVQVQADLTHLAFEVDSLQAFGEHLAELGLRYSDGPTYKPDGSGGFAFVDAPEGYEIELIQRSPAAGLGAATY